MGAFKEPHGGMLKDLYLSESRGDEEKIKAKDYKSWDLTQRQICDLDLLMNGAFSPLEGFLDRLIGRLTGTTPNPSVEQNEPASTFSPTRRKHED